MPPSGGNDRRCRALLRGGALATPQERMAASLAVEGDDGSSAGQLTASWTSVMERAANERPARPSRASECRLVAPRRASDSRKDLAG